MRKSSQAIALFVFLALSASTAHAQTWQIAESDNFRIFHTEKEAYGPKAAKYAEKCRTDYYKRWLNGKEPAWRFKCDIYIYPDSDSFKKGTGMMTSPAFAEVSYDGGGPFTRTIKIQGDCEDLWSSVFPHEISHVCQAGTMWNIQLPSFLDEGIAGQSESEVRLNEYKDNLRMNRERWGSRVLMNAVGYPKKNVREWYSESISLVRYLLTLNNEANFGDFVKYGRVNGWQKAIKAYYGYASYEELDQGWLKWVGVK